MARLALRAACGKTTVKDRAFLERAGDRLHWHHGSMAPTDRRQRPTPEGHWFCIKCGEFTKLGRVECTWCHHVPPLSVSRPEAHKKRQLQRDQEAARPRGFDRAEPPWKRNSSQAKTERYTAQRLAELEAELRSLKGVGKAGKKKKKRPGAMALKNAGETAGAAEDAAGDGAAPAESQPNIDQLAQLKALNEKCFGADDARTQRAASELEAARQQKSLATPLWKRTRDAEQRVTRQKNAYAAAQAEVQKAREKVEAAKADLEKAIEKEAESKKNRDKSVEELEAIKTKGPGEEAAQPAPSLKRFGRLLGEDHPAYKAFVSAVQEAGPPADDDDEDVDAMEVSEQERAVIESFVSDGAAPAEGDENAQRKAAENKARADELINKLVQTRAKRPCADAGENAAKRRLQGSAG